MIPYLVGLTVGVLYATGVYLLLQRSLGQAIVGLALLANATNVLIFVAAGLSEEGAPLVPVGEESLAADAADPVPQALILTAIVISFGLLGFFIALATQAYRLSGDDDLEVLRRTDEIAPPERLQ